MTKPEASSDHDATTVMEPPTTLGGILGKLGPGLIIAGSIVGSGELIATTKTGAEAGFWLLWLILIGCVIKVFVQIEFGRFTIVNNQTAMTGMNAVPGPRIGRGNWLMWFWLIMFLASLGQLGGIVGGVGQALSISVPITAEGQLANKIVGLKIEKHMKAAEQQAAEQRAAEQHSTNNLGNKQLAAQRAKEIGEIQKQLKELGKPPKNYDDKIWAALITAITIVLLVNGRYSMIQIFSTAMVTSFTLVTVVNLCELQTSDNWAVSLQDIKRGMSFGFPPARPGNEWGPLTTALATFGIIGVGAAELIAYPYWCLEKGYARFTGKRQEGEDWGRRAQGWLRVMRWDAWCSMVVYTFATIAFYLLGATVLNRVGLNPAGGEMIHTLSVMYKPVFGSWAQSLFLFGAIAVLYSTFFIANAGNTRMSADAVSVFGLSSGSDRSRKSLIRVFSILFPATSLFVYIIYPQPGILVLVAAAMQAIMLPMLGAAALYFRYRRGDSRTSPGKLSDACLWLSVAGLLLAGGWMAGKALTKIFETVFAL